VTEGRAAEDPGPTGLSFSPWRLPFWLTWTGFMAFTAVMNALSTSQDLARRGASFRSWEPFVWEATSAVATLVLLPGLAWLVERRPWLPRPGAATAGLYAAAAVAFSALHVAGMVALRKGVYAVALGPYRFGPLPGEFLYELRKDLVSFLIVATILNLLHEVERRLVAPVLASPPAADAATAPAGRITIRDGAREVEIDAATIHAVRAAGNYVELFRAGERPQMLRATLAEVEARLATAGFARVHRSWLVALDQVASATPSRSGDLRARLRDGSEVPVSRRYKDALPALRG
jgi:hypothetical protein